MYSTWLRGTLREGKLVQRRVGGGMGVAEIRWDKTARKDRQLGIMFLNQLEVGINL